MGSGISINKEQIICIIQRELDNEYIIKLNAICQYTDDGYFIYETFDHESEYNNKQKILRDALYNLQLI
jgi:hypothetical protein